LVLGCRFGSRDLITLATKIMVSGSWLRICAIRSCSLAAVSAGESPRVMLLVPACRSTMSGRYAGIHLSMLAARLSMVQPP
jgi:hypothetical protein